MGPIICYVVNHKLADRSPEDSDLGALVRYMDRDPTRSQRRISDLLDEDEEAFVRRAIRVLNQTAEARGGQFVLGLLVERGILPRLLCEPSMSLATAVKLARAASHICPEVDQLLARSVTDLSGRTGGCGQIEQITRLMEILTEVAEVRRVLPSLVRLSRHTDPHIRSKAVRMIGRDSGSLHWVRHRLGDHDPRTRANAVEGLWGSNGSEARELFERLVEDPNNRVAGNAILGLYRMGLVSAIPAALRLADHESPLFRATAAWVMGESRDPRFTEALVGMLREPKAAVRRCAFTALARIRAAVAHATQSPPCRLAARFLEGEPQNPARRLALTVSGAAGGQFPNLAPTQILLSENGQMVSQYHLIERPPAETSSVAFVLPSPLPQPLRDCILGCLPWKRPSDFWSRAIYDPEPGGKDGTEHAASPFCASPEAIRREFDRVPVAQEVPDLWRAVARSVGGALPGVRHLILFGPPNPALFPGEELVEKICALGVFVQVISRNRDSVLEEFCRNTNGTFWRMQYPAQLRAFILHAYLLQLAQYEVAYQPAERQAEALRIRVHGPSLWGETTVPIPARAASPVKL